jgi:hypothetical protein
MDRLGPTQTTLFVSNANGSRYDGTEVEQLTDDQWEEGTPALPDGKPSDGKFAVTTIWQQLPAGWRVIYCHESWMR